MKPMHIKRQEAEARNAAWAALTPSQQLLSLDQRFPQGAKRQKERIIQRVVADSMPKTGQLSSSFEPKEARDPKVKMKKKLRRDKHEAKRQARIHQGGKK